MAQVAAADRSLATGQVAAAVDAAAGNGQALRSLAAALAGRAARDVLADGAPPGVGRLVGELIARGSAGFTAPACKSCGSDRAAADPLKPGRGLSPLPEPAARDRLRPLRRGQAGRRPHRRRRAGLRAVPPSRARAPALRDVRQDRSDRGPGPRRGRGRVRELLPDAAGRLHGLRHAGAACNFAGGGNPVCKTCAPRCHEPLRRDAARTGRRRALARGPGLRHLLHQRAAPPRRLRGLRSAAAADRAARPGRDHVRGLRRTAAHPSCARCAASRTNCSRKAAAHAAACAAVRRDLLAEAEAVPGLTVVAEAITAARNPYSALNWLRTGGAAVILAEIAAGRTALTHQALDVHPDRRAADYLRHMLVAGGVLPARDEALARVELMEPRGARRHRANPPTGALVQAYLTWRVLRRLRRRSETSPGPRTATGGAGTRSAPWPPSWPGSASTTSPWPPAARATWRPG